MILGGDLENVISHFLGPKKDPKKNVMLHFLGTLPLKSVSYIFQRSPPPLIR